MTEVVLEIFFPKVSSVIPSLLLHTYHLVLMTPCNTFSSLLIPSKNWGKTQDPLHKIT